MINSLENNKLTPSEKINQLLIQNSNQVKNKTIE